MKRVVWSLLALGLICAMAPSFAAGPRQWIPLNQATNTIAIDYHSIDMKGANITLDLRQQFAKPQTDGDVVYETAIHHYTVDCDKQSLDRISSHAYDARARNNEGAEVHPPAAMDHITLGSFKSFCIWHQHGFALPDITLDAAWEDMEQTSSVVRITEAPVRRQKKDHLVLFAVRNDFSPPVTANGATFSYALIENLYQCDNPDSNGTMSLFYDAEKKPIEIAFYHEQSSMPKLDSNRERYAAACN